jgi:4-hydroxythreonine-4-phosphate dehydrogenase
MRAAGPPQGDRPLGGKRREATHRGDPMRAAGPPQGDRPLGGRRREATRRGDHKSAAVALVAGDPAGIGPELVAKLLADRAALPEARIRLIAQRASLDAGARAAGVVLDLPALSSRAAAASDAPVARLEWDGWEAPPFPSAQATAANGAFMLDSLRFALDLAQRGEVDAVCFAPLNKAALRAGGMVQEDELRWFAEVLQHRGVCGEFNVLEQLWTSRVTSHVALKDVAGLLSAEGVAASIGMLHDALRRAGSAAPRIGVCGLNPHNGDNGSYGREEIDIIAPGIALAAQRGHRADGPYPADTIFVRAKGGAFDGIVTMYHDQGQIAMKLMGFERGVTVQGGLPVAITTPAHGTAYEIAGRGIANTQAMKNALALAARMAAAAH